MFPIGEVGNVDWIHPGDPAVGGPAELSAAVIIPVVLQNWYWNPCPVPLVLSMVNHCLSPPVAGPRRVQDWPPFERAPHVVKECLQKAEIEKTPCVIGVQHRVAAEDVVFQNAGERPGRAAIGCVSIAGLPEVGVTLLNCLQPIAILLRSVGSTAMDGSFAASPMILWPFASTFT